MRRTPIMRSSGETEARAYASFVVPPSRATPTVDEARVVISEPRATKATSEPPQSSGPRNPEQTTWPAPKAPGIELPDRRPLMKAQRIWIDPELLEQWDREEEAKRAQGR